MSTKFPNTLPRFLAPGLGSAGEEAILPAGESHHLARVLRLRPGDHVAVFDGRGREFIARVARADRAAAAVSLVTEVDGATESRVPFAVVPGLLKGTAMDDVVRDATMMGASSIEPVVSRRVVARSILTATAPLNERWGRVALASAKQCRRAVVPAVHPVRTLDDWLASADHELRLLFVEPSAEVQAKPLRAFYGTPRPASAALMVGPEGGWSSDELKASVSAGCVPVTLGSLTLRADAVPLAAAALFRFVWDD